MDIELKKIINYYKVYNKIQDYDIPINLAYKFSKLTQSIGDEIDFYTVELNKIINKYADEDQENLIDKPGSIKIKPECIEQCNEDIKNLENLIITLPDINFTLDELSCMQLSINDLNILMPFIKEKE